MDFEKFAEACRLRNLMARDCGNGHWRIEGGKQSVNYYPTSKKKSIYINGTDGRISFPGSDKLAIETALGHLEKGRKGRASSHYYRMIRQKLMAVMPYCAICRKRLGDDDATLDHIIPKSKGGTDLEGNFQLACQPCNLKKGASID